MLKFGRLLSALPSVANATIVVNSAKSGKELKSLYSPKNQGQGLIAVVPEPATWAMMILGFGLIEMGLQRTHPTVQSIGRRDQSA